jgi:CelD/BcsL family acetyltransferase involved in cellulose biosynthesis
MATTPEIICRDGSLGLHDDAAASVIACAAPTISVRPWQAVFNDVACVEAWDQLASVASEPNPFNERWYLAAAVKALDAAGTVNIATIYSGDMLVGVMPIERRGDYARMPVRFVTNWLNYNAFLGTPLIRAGYERLFWRSLLSYFDMHPKGGWFFHANAMAINGPVAEALVSECTQQGRRHALVNRVERALLDKGLSPSEYLETHLRGKKRKELRRQHSRLGELGSLIIERKEDDAGLGDWIEEFLSLERSGWKGQNGSALDCANETRSLFRDIMVGAAADDKLQRLTMRLDGKAIAMLVNFLTPPGAFSFKTAFDESFARFSPGVLLQIDNLRLLEREGIAWCDSCAAQDHPMIDSLWAGRRSIGRWSVAIGGAARRGVFAALLAAEQGKAKRR